MPPTRKCRSNAPDGLAATSIIPVCRVRLCVVVASEIGEWFVKICSAEAEGAFVQMPKIKRHLMNGFFAVKFLDEHPICQHPMRQHPLYHELLPVGEVYLRPVNVPEKVAAEGFVADVFGFGHKTGAVV